MDLEVNGDMCEVYFNYTPQEGDGWELPFIPEDFEIISCEPYQPDEDVIHELLEYRDNYY